MSRELLLFKNSDRGWIASGRIQALSGIVKCTVLGGDERALEVLLKKFWEQDDTCEDRKLTYDENTIKSEE